MGKRAEEIAARAVNKESAVEGIENLFEQPGWQALGQWTGRRTIEQPNGDASKLGIEGRSKTKKGQQQRAVAGAKSDAAMVSGSFDPSTPGTHLVGGRTMLDF